METCGYTGGTGWPHRGQGAGRRPSDGSPGLTDNQQTLRTLDRPGGPPGETTPSFWHLRPCPAKSSYHCARHLSPCAFSTLPTLEPHLTAVFEPKFHFYLSQAAYPASPRSPPRGLKLPVSFLDQTLSTAPKGAQASGLKWTRLARPSYGVSFEGNTSHLGTHRAHQLRLVLALKQVHDERVIPHLVPLPCLLRHHLRGRMVSTQETGAWAVHETCPLLPPTLTSSGRPSESTVSVYGLFCMRFRSSCSPSNRKAMNSWASCCA